MKESSTDKTSFVREKLSNIKNGDAGKAQFARFIINGCLAAGVHYGVYFILLQLVESNICDVQRLLPVETLFSIAYAIGYIISFAVNFYFTCYFTFRTAPSLKRFIGFSGSHAVNFCLHIILFWICMQLGVHRLLAPIIVMGIAMLVQFTILRFIFKH